MKDNSFEIFKICDNEWELEIKDNTGLYHLMHLNQEKLSYIVNDLKAKGYAEVEEDFEEECYADCTLDDFDYLEAKGYADCTAEDLEEDFE